MKMVTKAVSGKHIKHNTPNRDLIVRCAAEMKWRSSKPGYETHWHDVKAHSKEEPWERKKADILAGEAADMPLPQHNAHLREPCGASVGALSLLHKGIPRQDDGLKTVQCTLEDEAAKAGDRMSPHLAGVVPTVHQEAQGMEPGHLLQENPRPCSPRTTVPLQVRGSQRYTWARELPGPCGRWLARVPSVWSWPLMAPTCATRFTGTNGWIMEREVRLM